MKFSPEHLAQLTKSIESTNVDIEATKAHYKVKGLSEQRFYWDLFWASQWHKSDECRNSDYLDIHIETAIKAAVKEITKKQDAL